VLSLGFSLAINEINKLSKLSYIFRLDSLVHKIHPYDFLRHVLILSPLSAGPAGKAYPMQKSNVKVRERVLFYLTAIAFSY
jgi:hypothetical protein